MKTTIAAILSVLLCSAAISMAADASGRVDTRVLAGVKNNVQDEFTRRTTPVWVLNSLYYNATNKSDGLIFVRTNATVLVHIGLPNPTNNVGRIFSITTCGASTATISNGVASGDFTDLLTLTNASVYFVASNKTATAYSTGTNWAVRLH